MGSCMSSGGRPRRARARSRHGPPDKLRGRLSRPGSKGAGAAPGGEYRGRVRDLGLERRDAAAVVGDITLYESPAAAARAEAEAEAARGDGAGADEAEDARYCDVAVVGTGVAGAYAAYRLRKKYGEAVTVALFERDSHVGGRLLSERPDPPARLVPAASPRRWSAAAPPAAGSAPAATAAAAATPGPRIRNEYGAMRVFPGAMPRTAALLRECGLRLVPVSTNDANNLFGFRGEVGTKTGFKVAGRTVRRLVAEAVATFYRAHPEEAGRDAFESERTRDMDYDTFLSTYGHLTSAQLAAVRAYSGYDLYDERVSVANFLRLWPLYGSERSDQFFVAEGYQELASRLLRSADRPVYAGHTVSSVVRRDDGLLELRFEGGTAPPWTARHVVLTGTKSELASVRKPPGDHRRWEAINDAAALPLFKAFLPFPRAWWRDLGLRHGKSTTDRKIRQVHYYGRSMLLVYCSGKPAAFWKGEFEKDPLTAARELLDQVREFHRVTPEQTGAPLRVDYHYWSDGSHKWLRDCDVHEARRLVAGLPPPDPEDEENGGGAGAGAGASPPGDAAAPAQGDAKKKKAGKKKAKKGQGKAAKTKKARGAVAGGAAAPRELLRGVELLHEHSGNLWVAGDAYSLYQGWVEGALEMVDAIMDEL